MSNMTATAMEDLPDLYVYTGRDWADDICEGMTGKPPWRENEV